MTDDATAIHDIVLTCSECGYTECRARWSPRDEHKAHCPKCTRDFPIMATPALVLRSARALRDVEYVDWSDAELTLLAEARYSEPPIPPCHICGAPLSLQSFGDGPSIWACDGRDEDGTLLPGRRLADDHYGNSQYRDPKCGGDELVLEVLRRWRKGAATSPIPMLLHCPDCGAQHVDAPEPEGWDNPPHRSHKCRACGSIWRPAAVPTVGVATIDSQGTADTVTLAGALLPGIARRQGALKKINALRVDILGRRTINWSRHIYPLVAALDEAGLESPGHEVARDRAIAEIDAFVAGERAALLATIIGHGPYDLPHAMERLHGAVDHLLDDHDCDMIGHESVRAALEASRRHFVRIHDLWRDVLLRKPEAFDNKPEDK